MAGKAMTVNGPIDPSRLGATIMHEHLFIDFWQDKVPPHNTPATDAALWDQKLPLENLHLARQFKPIKDNFILGDEASTIAEAMEFRKYGGSTVVDVTSIGLGRDPLALRRVANATGLNIVMGAGWCQKAYHPEDMDDRTVNDLAHEIVRDITEGVAGTGIRSGIIGEVGINGDPVTPNEAKSLQASARASRAAGAAISLHMGGAGREKFQVASILGAEGADLSRVVFGHSDIIAGDLPFMLELLSHGVSIQFDILGAPFPAYKLQASSHAIEDILGVAMTALAVEAIPKLVAEGFEDRILLSQDVCTKTQRKRYGDNGYSFVLETVLPELRRKGLTEAQLNKLVVDNPKRVLTFVAPK